MTCPSLKSLNKNYIGFQRVKVATSILKFSQHVQVLWGGGKFHAIVFGPPQVFCGPDATPIPESTSYISF